MSLFRFKVSNTLSCCFFEKDLFWKDYQEKNLCTFLDVARDPSDAILSLINQQVSFQIFLNLASIPALRILRNSNTVKSTPATRKKALNGVEVAQVFKARDLAFLALLALILDNYLYKKV